MRRDLVHRLHRFDDEDGLALGDAGADGDESAACRARARGRRCRPSARSGCRDWSEVVGGGAAAGGGAGGRERRGGSRRRRRVALRSHGLLDAVVGEGAGDADAEVFALDLDLGEVLLVEQLGDGADQVLIRLAMPWSSVVPPCALFSLVA